MLSISGSFGLFDQRLTLDYSHNDSFETWICSNICTFFVVVQLKKMDVGGQPAWESKHLYKKVVKLGWILVRKIFATSNLLFYRLSVDCLLNSSFESIKFTKAFQWIFFEQKKYFFLHCIFPFLQIVIERNQNSSNTKPEYKSKKKTNR